MEQRKGWIHCDNRWSLDLFFSAFNTMKSQGKVGYSWQWSCISFLAHVCSSDHHARADWMSALRVNLENIHGINGKDLDFNCVDIFSSLVNQLLVDLFKPRTEKAVSTRYFECLVNIWRTFHQIIQNINTVGKLVNQKITSFYKDSFSRHKQQTLDMGKFMVLTSMVQFDQHMFRLIFRETI